MSQIITDSFNRSDNTNLNAANDGKTDDGAASSWSWTEAAGDLLIESNQIRSNSNNVNCFARAEVDLTTEHYVKVTLTALGAALNSSITPSVKADDSAFTCYGFMIRQRTTEGITYRLTKRVNGSLSDLTSQVTLSESIPMIIMCTCKNVETGVEVKGYINGEIKATAIDTDSPLTDNTKAGLHFLGFNSGWTFGDDFEAGVIQQNKLQMIL